MADDSDVPPLEDMTEVLKQVNAIKEHKLGTASGNNRTKTETATNPKEKAKVTKKSLPARAGSSPETPTNTSTQAKADHSSLEAKKATTDCDVATKQKNVESHKAKETGSSTKKSQGSAGFFGGMKKGFMFGNPGKMSSSQIQKNSGKSASDTKKETVGQSQNTVTSASGNKPCASQKTDEEIPYITKSEKTEIGLAFNEVQQAMPDAKGLLDNQDWINDEFLNKIEKNKTLVKRFADPQFMQALQEFQTNPQTAMEKYKGNTEVEKFLTDFCGLLGDHFTSLGDKEDKQTNKPNSQKTPSSQNVIKPENVPAKTKPKIVEISDDSPSNVAADVKDREKKTAKIVELTQENSPTKELKTKADVPKASPNIDIQTRRSEDRADIQEIPKVNDEEVKKVLDDPKVMETLMDPKVMNLIQQLKSDPAEAQRIVDGASSDFREKIKFLISQGLLQFQSS